MPSPITGCHRLAFRCPTPTNASSHLPTPLIHLPLSTIHRPPIRPPQPILSFLSPPPAAPFIWSFTPGDPSDLHPDTSRCTGLLLHRPCTGLLLNHLSPRSPDASRRTYTDPSIIGRSPDPAPVAPRQHLPPCLPPFALPPTSSIVALSCSFMALLFAGALRWIYRIYLSDLLAFAYPPLTSTSPPSSVHLSIGRIQFWRLLLC